MRRRSATARDSGLTITEVMIVVVILGVLAALAAPNLRELFIANRLTASSSDFYASLNLARSEAMRLGQVVTMRRCDATAFADAASGCAVVSGRAEWSRGWYMFIDTDRNRLRDTGAGSTETVLRTGQAAPAPVTIYANGGTAADAISFCPDGRMFGFPSCGVGGNSVSILAICYENTLARNNRPRSQAILINLAGRIRMAVHNNAGVPLNAAGAALTSCTSPSYPFGVTD
jgi:type IV fimbrial biogenesis protein FimT